jgi:hypothetical protein
MFLRMASRVSQYSSCADNQNASQVSVALLGDAAEPFLATL